MQQHPPQDEADRDTHAAAARYLDHLSRFPDRDLKPKTGVGRLLADALRRLGRLVGGKAGNGSAAYALVLVGLIGL